MAYVLDYSRRLQSGQSLGLKLRLVRAAEVGAVVVSFLFLFAFVAGLV